jgi:hypothetical protein
MMMFGPRVREQTTFSTDTSSPITCEHTSTSRECRWKDESGKAGRNWKSVKLLPYWLRTDIVKLQTSPTYEQNASSEVSPSSTKRIRKHKPLCSEELQDYISKLPRSISNRNVVWQRSLFSLDISCLPKHQSEYQSFHHPVIRTYSRDERHLHIGADACDQVQGKRPIGTYCGGLMSSRKGMLSSTSTDYSTASEHHLL